MKKLLFVAATFILSANVFAGTTSGLNGSSSMIITIVNATPPPAVLSSFHSYFGNPPVRQWKSKGNGLWRAHFMKNGVAWEATFTITGTLVKSEPA